MRCRKNVSELTAGEKSDFVAAILGLKARDSALHPGAQSRYDDYVEIHRSAMDAVTTTNQGVVTNPGWGHFDSAFFPWHRELLYRFEEDLRTIRPNVTIPYWDWSRARSAGSSGWPFTHDFIAEDGTDAAGDRVQRQPGAGNPYPYPFDPETWTVVVTDLPTDPLTFRRAFGERTDAPQLPLNDTVVTGSNTTVRQALGSGAYTTLRARSEDLHNLVHRWAGGNMITASSPNDPVFWMHHAQIDRMWSLWLDINHDTNPPPEKYVHNNGFAGHGLNDTLIFQRAGDPAPWTGTATPNQLLNSHAMHGTSIWYQSDRPEVSLASGSTLDFGYVPQGMTQYRAVRFQIRTCRQLRFRVTTPGGNFGLPSGPQFIVEPDLAADTVNGSVWFEFRASADDTSSVTIEAFLLDAEGYLAASEGGEVLLNSWTVSLTGHVVPREDNAVVLVLDRSFSMSASAGGVSTRTGLLKEAVSVFHTLLRGTDEIGIVSFDDVTDDLLPLTTQAAGLGSTLTGSGLDPRGNTGIGLGVQAGIAMLAGATHTNRSLVVLTDGNQNVHPYVEELPPGTINTRTYAVGFGLPGDVSDDTLQAIAHNTRGSFVVTGLLDTDQDRYLLTKHFVQILAGVTAADIILDPQNVLLIGSEDVTPFQVTEADVSIDVIILTPLTPFIDVLVRTPDGTIIDPSVAAAELNIEYQIEPYVAFYRIELPALPAAPDGSHAGTWEIVTRVRSEQEIHTIIDGRDGLVAQEDFALLRRMKKVPYSTVVHTRSNLRFAIQMTQESMKPGALVALDARLFEYDVPFTGDARVWADVTAPNGVAVALPFAETDAGAYHASFVASQTGIYRARVRADGVTRLGSTFTRESTHTVGCFDGERRAGDKEPTPENADRNRLGSVDADESSTDNWKLDDLVERRPQVRTAWPTMEERAAAAEEAELRRLEMARHGDPGWMMFPSIQADGRVAATSPHPPHSTQEHHRTDEHHEADEHHPAHPDHSMGGHDHDHDHDDTTGEGEG